LLNLVLAVLSIGIFIGASERWAPESVAAGLLAITARSYILLVRFNAWLGRGFFF
jgi:hypothetical protein